MTDRHREKPLSLRLGPDRQRLEDFARDTKTPVRRVITDAVRAWLDKHESRFRRESSGGGEANTEQEN